jgi:5-methyltetrahydrofolate corrinoid/iron sulfur protein methyltransferase
VKVIADNLNVLNPVVFQALNQLDPEPIQTLALQCRKAGADFIDINPGYLPKGREDRMGFMVEAVQAVTDLGLVLDSPNPRVLARGLTVCRGKAIINALTLEENKIGEILSLAVEHGSPLILLLIDDHSRSPNSLEEKIALAVELRERAVTAGIPEGLLLFDPLIPHLSWPDASAHIQAAMAFIRLSSSGALFNQEVETVVGLSNLCSGYKQGGSLPIEKTCLGLMAGAGLSHVLMNVLRPELGDELRRIRQLTGAENAQLYPVDVGSPIP